MPFRMAPQMLSIPQLEHRMQAVKLMRQFVPRLGAVNQVSLQHRVCDCLG